MSKENRTHRAIRTAFWKLMGFQMVIGAFVFHMWLQMNGADPAAADNAANLLITAGVLALLYPVARDLFVNYRRGDPSD